MKKYAPYLKINSQDIELGQKYFTVNKESLDLKERKAGKENNTIEYNYYFDISQAKQYILENAEVFNFKDIERIENINLPPWQKREEYLKLAKMRVK
jgi:hypothetical protein